MADVQKEVEEVRASGVELKGDYSGTTLTWQVSDQKKFPGGEPHPCPCNCKGKEGFKHYYVEC